MFSNVKGTITGESTYCNNKIEIPDAIYVPNMIDNLLSFRKFAELGYTIILNNKNARILDGKTLILKGIYRSPFWYFMIKCNTNDALVTRTRNRIYTYEQPDELTNTNENDNNDNLDPPKTPNPFKRRRKQNRPIVNVDDDFEIDENEELEAGSVFTEIEREDENSDHRLCIDDILIQHEIPHDSNIQRNEIMRMEPKSMTPEEYLEYKSQCMIWHRRLGHMDYKKMVDLKLRTNLLKNVKIDPEMIENCIDCKIANMKKLKFHIRRRRATRPFHTIHSDIIGPITPVSFKHRFKWIISFVDDYSRFAACYVMHKKNDALNCFKMYLDHINNITDSERKQLVRVFRSDNGGEYTSDEFQTFLS